MRKYFLLSAVALLATSTANANTDYAEITAKATIQEGMTIFCDTDLNFGTITVKHQNKASTVVIDSKGNFSTDGDILSVDGVTAAKCEDDGGLFNVQQIQMPESVILTNGTNDKITVSNLTPEYDPIINTIGGTLNIPNNVKEGEYIGSFTLITTY